MRLDTITRMEQFIVDMLLSSPQIPLGVNVVRLAAAQETEGISNMARTIVVRYLGSQLTVTNQAPLVTERRMNFQLDLASQEYLTESGHDYVIQMCAGAYNTLINQVPPNTGVEVVEASVTRSGGTFRVSFVPTWAEPYRVAVCVGGAFCWFGGISRVEEGPMIVDGDGPIDRCTKHVSGHTGGSTP